MIPELKAEIDKSIEHAEKHFTEQKLGEIDCWVMLKILDEKVDGEPLAIFKTKERLYEKFDDVAKIVDPKSGIVVAAWKFD